MRRHKKNTSDTGSRWHSSGFFFIFQPNCFFFLSYSLSLCFSSLSIPFISSASLSFTKKFVFYLFLLFFPYLIYSADFPKCAQDSRLYMSCMLPLCVCVPIQKSTFIAEIDCETNANWGRVKKKKLKKKKKKEIYEKRF